uniref:CSON014347 protein n=1 Tax=Culicoides sonorensis TaxID=179676 RepID=A0A336MAH7_CULSO
MGFFGHHDEQNNFFYVSFRINSCKTKKIHEKFILNKTSFQADFITYVEKLKYWSDTKYIDFKAWLTYKDNDITKYLFNIELDVLEEGGNYLFINSKYFESPEGNRNESKKLLDINIEICAFLKRSRKGEVLTGLFLGILNKHGRIFKKCPVPKGLYYAYNMTLNGIELPGILKYYMGSKNTKLTYEVHTKFGKKLYKLANLTFWAGYKNV